MIAGTLPSRPYLTLQAESDLADLLSRARDAAVRRAALPEDAPYWAAAETRSAMAFARADRIFGGNHDPRTLLAVLTAAVARVDLGAACGPSASRLSTPDADKAFDSTRMAGWLRATCASTPECDLYAQGATAAAEVLAFPGADDEVLAAAWTAVCGLSLLELVAKPGSTAFDVQPSESEIRLVQRVTVHCLVTHRGTTPAQLSRLVAGDRRTMSAWLRYGSPSTSNRGLLVRAQHCATIVGVTVTEWHTLEKQSLHQQSPTVSTAHLPLPRPVEARRAATWDEGEVMTWFESHEADSCHRLCRRHAGEDLSIAAVAVGRQPYPCGGSALPQHGPRSRRLYVVS